MMSVLEQSAKKWPLRPLLATGLPHRTDNGYTVPTGWVGSGKELKFTGRVG